MSHGKGKRGKRVSISLPRQYISDLVYFGQKVPSIPVQRKMNVALTVAARSGLRSPPSWALIFAKAYGQVCEEFPQLRRSYLGFPWAGFYEHYESVASIAIEKQYNGEPAVCFVQMGELLTSRLEYLDHCLRKAREIPVHEMRTYRHAGRMYWLPASLRRTLWWLALNLSGSVRGRVFGTFGVSVYASLGAESLHPLSPLTTTLNYGPIAADGSVNVRIVYDHRVMDGATVARALARFEIVLNTQSVEELKAFKEDYIETLAKAA